MKTTDEHAIAEEFHLLHLQVIEEMKEYVPLKEFWTRPALRKRCFIGWLTMAAGQCTGTIVINSEFSYCNQLTNQVVLVNLAADFGPFLYKKLGFTVVKQLLIQCGWISVCLLGNIFNAIVVDRVGRVRMLREYPSSVEDEGPSDPSFSYRS